MKFFGSDEVQGKGDKDTGRKPQFEQQVGRGHRQPIHHKQHNHPNRRPAEIQMFRLRRRLTNSKTLAGPARLINQLRRRLLT